MSDLTTIRQQQADYAAKHLGEGMRLFYRRLAALIVDFPDKLKVVTELETGCRMALIAIPCDEDAGKLIGSKGVMFHSFRSLLQQFGRRIGLHVHYSLETKSSGKSPEAAFKFVSKDDWPKESLFGTFADTCEDLFGPGNSSLRMEHEGDKSRCWIEVRGEEVVKIPLAELHDGLSRVWHACGRAKGRLIYLDSLKVVK